MVLEQAGRKVWRLAQRFVGPVLRARWLPLVVVAVFALVRRMQDLTLMLIMCEFLLCHADTFFFRYLPISPSLQRWTPRPLLTKGVNYLRQRTSQYPPAL